MLYGIGVYIQEANKAILLMVNSETDAQALHGRVPAYIERRRSHVEITPKAVNFLGENHLLWVHDLPLNLIHAKCFIHWKES